ncbi:MAG: hypothetical protein VW518_09285, partial [Burkholderiaceae bacterium]
VKNHISLMKQVSNKKIDAITIEYLYPESEKLGNYHTKIISAYSLIEETWNEFWKNYPTKKIEQIENFSSENVESEIQDERIKYKSPQNSSNKDDNDKGIELLQMVPQVPQVPQVPLSQELATGKPCSRSASSIVWFALT